MLCLSRRMGSTRDLKTRIAFIPFTCPAEIRGNLLSVFHIVNQILIP